VANVEEVALAIPAMQSELYRTLDRVEAHPVASDVAVVDAPLGVARGYAKADLTAVAEIAYHYLMSGGLRLALTLFEGLVAVAPNEPYHHLGLGLALDRLDDKAGAEARYRRAGKLDRRDPRPDINRAELHLEVGNRAEAKKLLVRGLAKAEAAHDPALIQKAGGMLRHLRR